jgi:hypothetical protein
MESDFSDIIVKLLRQAEPELDGRLEYQAEALDEEKCTNPLLGRWIDTNHAEYLLAAFSLNDSDFEEYFPQMTGVTEHHRKRIVRAFEDHFGLCRHCSLKRGYDAELDGKILRLCRDNKDHLIHQLKPENSETVTESDHLDLQVSRS